MLAFRLLAQTLIPLETDAATPDELTRRLPRGLYTTFSTLHGGTRVLGLTAHLNRLNLPSLASRADLRRALANLAAANAPGESRFRVLHSGTDGAVYVIVQPFTPLPREIYERGVKVITAEMIRRDPRLKDSGFIAESQSARAKVGGEIFEVLLTKKGKIYEGMTSNFYAILPSVPQDLSCEGQDESCGTLQNEFCGTLVTTRYGILLGVTRRAVLRLARGQGMNIEYRPPRVDEDFAEAFLTSSSRGVVPIVQIDDRAVGEGRVGAWTKRLIEAYQAYVEKEAERIVE